MITRVKTGFSVVMVMAACSSTAYGQALGETTALLTNPVERQKLIDTDSQAKQADNQVKALGLSPAKQEKLYGLSGKIFETLSKQVGDDAEKLESKVQELTRDPASLENDLTQEQKSEIHLLASPEK